MAWVEFFRHNAHVVYWAVVLAAWVVAYYETFWNSGLTIGAPPASGFIEDETVGGPDAGRVPISWDWIQQGAKIAGWLALAQLFVMVLLYCIPDLSWQVWVCWQVFLCTLPVAGLWASGKAEQVWRGWPVTANMWSGRKKFGIAAALWAGGVVMSVVLLILVKVQPGEFLKEFSHNSGLDSGYSFAAFWLLINAPWIEELTFRHYLLPRFSRWFGGGRGGVIVALVVTSAIFACGHASHTIPAWPKLVQVMAWGLALGWVRIWMGTGWSIGLHLAWNLSAIAVGMFVA